MKSRAIIPLVVGLAVGGIAVKVFWNVLKKARAANASEAVEVVRAAADIAPTIEISQAMVTTTTAPKTLLPDGVFSDPTLVVGRVTSQMIPKGMPIAASLLAPEGTPPGMVAKIPDGYRAVAIQVDEFIGVGGFVKPGARVDVVIVMTGRSKNQNISRVILQNVEVLAVGQKTETGTQGAAVTRSATVLVRPEDASKLHLASVKGKLRLALRSQDDHREPKPVMLTDEDLLTDGRAARRRNADDNSVFSALFGNLSKPDKPQVDVTTGPGAAAEQKDWEVEVMSGSEVYKVRFDPTGKNVGDAPAEPQSADKNKFPRISGAVLPGVIPGRAVNPGAAATPNAGDTDAEDGGAEQDKMLETAEAAED